MNDFLKQLVEETLIEMLRDKFSFELVGIAMDILMYSYSTDDGYYSDEDIYNACVIAINKSQVDSNKELQLV